ncbi:MAG TPA: energy transducer TonB [Pyrinomonadaceae bacterium]|jgi:TonB family protein|nr:energy transducer TonB [Pyrinomonadaceae bacterium]
MNARHSTATPVNQYQPTIIESGLLLSRLAVEIDFLKTQLKLAWIDFQRHPKQFTKQTLRGCLQRSRVIVRALPATSVALVILTIAIAFALLVDRKKSDSTAFIDDEAKPEIVMLNPANQAAAKPETKPASSIGKDGKGRVGFQSGTGEDSGATPKLARGGGGGGERNPVAPQAGKLPPPSSILAAIPRAPPVHPLSLPVAGMDIDPALWKDLKAPVYGDPRSASNIPSKGPGEGEGIGTNRGLGVGSGNGPGYGPGEKGNMGDGSNEQGCCGTSGGSDDGYNRTFRGNEVDQRARLLSKPEPQYTEEARRNQLSGTVTLRVIFSSAGEVVQIHALRTLPFGLTEKAIAAARLIKFVPAIKGGRPVSVHMQLEYNFNLY